MSNETEELGTFTEPAITVKPSAEDPGGPACYCDVCPVLCFEYMMLALFVVQVIVCVPGNIISMVVLKKWCQRSFTRPNIFLFTVAASDFTGMIVSVPTVVYEYCWIRGGCYEPLMWFLWPKLASWYLSDMLLVAFSVERLLRFLSVKPQHLASGSSRRTNTFIGIAVLVAISLTVSLHPLIGHAHEYLASANKIEYVKPQWIQEWKGGMDYFEAAFPIVIAIALASLNTFLLVVIWTHRRSRRSLQISASDSARSDRQAHVMLTACVIMYLVTQAPLTALHILDMIRKRILGEDELHIWCDLHHQYFTKGFAQLSQINYSTNFILYVGISGRFREDTAALFQPLFGHFKRPQNNQAAEMQVKYYPGADMDTSSETTSLCSVWPSNDKLQRGPSLNAVMNINDIGRSARPEINGPQGNTC